MAFFLYMYMPTPARKWCRMLNPHRLEMIVSPCPAPMGTMSCKDNGWFGLEADLFSKNWLTWTLCAELKSHKGVTEHQVDGKSKECRDEEVK